jgi:hypothetical protein
MRLELVVVPVSDVIGRSASTRRWSGGSTPTSSGAGVDVSETFHDATGIFHHSGTEVRPSGPASEHADLRERAFEELPT